MTPLRIDQIDYQWRLINAKDSSFDLLRHQELARWAYEKGYNSAKNEQDCEAQGIKLGKPTEPNT